MADLVKVELGAIQKTLFIPLSARARETRRKHPVLRDPKAAEILASVDFDADAYGRNWGGGITVLRTAIIDSWVRNFLTQHPGGTVVDVGTGLNTRFERAGNDSAHWVDLDLPDTIELRRKFFADSGNRRMLAASITDYDWITAVQKCPAPHFFAIEGVLAYLEQAPQILSRIAEHFPGALLAFDTYSQRMLQRQHQMAAKRNMDAQWAWACDDPRTLESLSLQVVEEAAVTRPPAAVRHQLPRWYRYALPMVSKIIGDISTITLFRAAARLTKRSW